MSLLSYQIYNGLSAKQEEELAEKKGNILGILLLGQICTYGIELLTGARRVSETYRCDSANE